MSRDRDIAKRDKRTPDATSSHSDIDAFLQVAKTLGPAHKDGARGRLIFAMDATMSRQPTWDIACTLQAEMFEEASIVGGLDVQLVYFRGFRECKASRWVADARALSDLMVKIDCRGGRTQIERILTHTRKEGRDKKIAALVYVGDAMEEHIDDLAHIAGELGLLGVKTFMFQEGRDPLAEQAFREIARLTNGAYCRFDTGSAHQLGKLLRAVAAYAAGGMTALKDMRAPEARLLIEQMK